MEPLLQQLSRSSGTLWICRSCRNRTIARSAPHFANDRVRVGGDLVRLQTWRSLQTSRRLSDRDLPRRHAQPLGDFYTDLLTEPIPKDSAATSDLPTFVRSGDETKEERAAKLFGNIHGSGYEKRVPSKPDATWRTINGVPIPPRPTEPDNCCMSGCMHCVWDDYRDDIEDWASRLKEAQAKGADQGQTNTTKLGLHRPDVATASGSMDDDGGGSEALWDTPSPTASTASELFADIPVGIREFMATEKRLRDRASVTEREKDGSVVVKNNLLSPTPLPAPQPPRSAHKPNNVRMLVRFLSSLFFLVLIVLTIPLTFDIGGRDAGLAYSLSLASFYFLLSLLRVSTPDHAPVRKVLINLLRGLQWFILPGLCLWALGRFSVDAGPDGGWVERTFRLKKELLDGRSLSEYIFGHEGVLETVAIGGWDKTLRWSSPIFQLLEGFCSLLVIQAIGQLSRWLVNRSEWSDLWMLTVIVGAASVSSTSVYFLWRVLQFPDISNLDSTLIGIAIASAIFLCAYGIVSGRGTAVESSLLFAYIVLCIYQIFTDYKPNEPIDASGIAEGAPALPPFPPIIMSSYTAVVQLLAELPGALWDAFDLVGAAFKAVAASVLISLGYRLFVFYASTRIIPAINESGARGLSIEPTLEDSNAGNQFLAFLSWFSPSILIAVYTSLLMQHFATTMGGYSPGLTETIGAWWHGNGEPGMDGNVWKWVNLVGTMALYAVELWLGRDEEIDGSHWKVD